LYSLQWPTFPAGPVGQRNFTLLLAELFRTQAQEGSGRADNVPEVQRLTLGTDGPIGTPILGITSHRKLWKLASETRVVNEPVALRSKRKRHRQLSLKQQTTHVTSGTQRLPAA